VRIQQVTRATASFGIGIFITFSQSHSAVVGLYSLGIFGLIVGVAGAAIALGKKSKGALQELPIATLATLIGIFSLLSIHNPATQEASFTALVAAWGLISGAFALYQARRWGFRDYRGKDHLLSAVVSLLLGILFLAVDLDIVSAVGFFGAYLALEGVHWGIAAGTPKSK
jgi:uncharacterized membrane protein HdeD (DUF308 family)